MKHPNGYGTVAKLSGKRRRPYVVRKTTGWNGDKQLVAAIGYFATREEAMLALAKYNSSPYDIDTRKITFQELFERWLKRTKEQQRLAKSTIAGLQSAYKYCAPIYSISYSALRAHMMQDCIDACPKGYGTKSMIKKLLHQLDKYALELDIVNKSYSCLLTTTPYIPEKEKRVFTGPEVAKLWDNLDIPWVDSILIYLYTGWRFTELLMMKLTDISLVAQTMSGGVKTKAGKGRVVPIHSSIYPLVEARCKSASTHFLEHNGRPISETQYRRRWVGIMQIIGANHTIHETRHTFRSWLDRAGANIACVNKIMGHTCSDIGLQTYTHKTIEELRATIELIDIKQTKKNIWVNNA